MDEWMDACMHEPVWASKREKVGEILLDYGTASATPSGPGGRGIQRACPNCSIRRCRTVYRVLAVVPLYSAGCPLHIVHV